MCTFLQSLYFKPYFFTSFNSGVFFVSGMKNKKWIHHFSRILEFVFTSIITPIFKNFYSFWTYKFLIWFKTFSFSLQKTIVFFVCSEVLTSHENVWFFSFLFNEISKNFKSLELLWKESRKNWFFISIFFEQCFFKQSPNFFLSFWKFNEKLTILIFWRKRKTVSPWKTQYCWQRT